ncbi:hypothetical protein ACQ86L_0775 (plasmid) [Leifsonia sp. P73]
MTCSIAVALSIATLLSACSASPARTSGPDDRSSTSSPQTTIDPRTQAPAPAGADLTTPSAVTAFVLSGNDASAIEKCKSILSSATWTHGATITFAQAGQMDLAMGNTDERFSTEDQQATTSVCAATVPSEPTPNHSDVFVVRGDGKTFFDIGGI